jgi:hypothetical protein
MKVKNPLKLFRRGRKTARQQSTHFPQQPDALGEDLFSDLTERKPTTLEADRSDCANRRFRSAPAPQREDVRKFRRKHGRNRFVDNSRERSAGGSRGRSFSPQPTSTSGSLPPVFEESSARISKLTRSSSRLMVHSDDEFDFFGQGPMDLSLCPKLPVRARSSGKCLRKGGSGGREREHAPTPKSSIRSSRNAELSEILGFC